MTNLNPSTGFALKKAVTVNDGRQRGGSGCPSAKAPLPLLLSADREWWRWPLPQGPGGAGTRPASNLDVRRRISTFAGSTRRLPVHLDVRRFISTFAGLKRRDSSLIVESKT
ncbi:hypothetical protein [Buchananella felis]|uniref:hypothetical protein n=1 Tax=Buchananella felis TaxID=3231492 RepID=UPI0035298B6C